MTNLGMTHFLHCAGGGFAVVAGREERGIRNLPRGAPPFGFTRSLARGGRAANPLIRLEKRSEVVFKNAGGGSPSPLGRGGNFGRRRRTGSGKVKPEGAHLRAAITEPVVAIALLS